MATGTTTNQGIALSDRTKRTLTETLSGLVRAWQILGIHHDQLEDDSPAQRLASIAFTEVSAAVDELSDLLGLEVIND